MKRKLVNFVIAVVGLALMFTLDQEYRARIRSENDRELAVEAAKAADSLTIAVAEIVTATEDLRAFMLAPAKLPDDETFDRFARLLMEHHHLIRAVQYVTPDRVIRRIYPLAGNEAALNLDLTTRPARPFVEEAIRERQLTVNHPTVTVQGLLSIIPRAPLYRQDEFLGLVQTVVEIDPLLESAGRTLGSSFEAQLSDATGARFWGPAVLADAASETIPVGNNFWTLRVGWRGGSPTPDAFVLALLWSAGSLSLLSLIFLVNRAWLRWTHGRQRAEERIHLQANMLDAVGSAVIATEPDGRVIYWNHAAETLYGWSSSEAVGRNILDLTPAQQSREQALAIMEQLTRGEVWSGEFVVQRKDGGSFPAFVVASPFRDSKGRLAGIIGVSNDLSERRRMEEALREAESLFRTVLSHAPITIFATNREGTFTLSEGKGLERVGLKPGENVGKSALDLYGSIPFFDENGEEMLGRQVFRRALSGETVTAVNELRGVHFINRVGPVRDAKEAVIGVVGVATDITDRMEAEKELRLQKELLQTIVDNIPVMIAFIGPMGRTRWVNRHWQRVLGWSLEEATSRDILPEMYPDPERRREVLSFALTADGRWGDFRTRTKDGEVVETSWANVRLSDGTSIGIGQDITERKRAENALRQRQRELETLLDISLRLSAELDVNELLRAIVESVVDTLPAAEASSLWLHDEVHGRLVPHAWSGHRDETFAGLSVPSDTTLVGRVFRTGESIFVADVSREAEFVHLARPGLDRLQSVIGAPLRIQGLVVGALFADNFSRLHAFRESDLLVLQGLAAQAGIALGNARLFEEIRHGRERVRALTIRLATSEEDERRDLSKKLHDQVSQSLTAIGINLALLRSRLEHDPVETSLARLAVAQETVEEVTERIRDVMTELHPAVLDDYGLLAALRWHAERLRLGTGLQVEVSGEEPAPALAPARAMALLRVAQEALTNVVKHAGVEKAVVQIDAQPDLVRMAIVDQGRGFDLAATAPDSRVRVRWGLLTMRERVEALGGRMQVETAPGKGTRVAVEMPR